MYDQINNFLKPKKSKIAVALALPYIWWIFLWSLTFVRIVTSQFEPILSPLEITFLGLFSMVIKFVFFSLLMYPFACSIVALIDSYKSKEIRKYYKQKGNLILVLVGLLFFNPLGLIALFITPLFIYATFINPTPAVQVVDIDHNSPLLDTLRPHMVIEEIRVRKYDETFENGKYIDEIVYERKTRIENSTVFYAILNNTNIEDSLSFETDGGSSYSFYVKENITDWGITVKDVG